jgi:hypothetical protein
MFSIVLERSKDDPRIEGYGRQHFNHRALNRTPGSLSVLPYIEMRFRSERWNDWSPTLDRPARPVKLDTGAEESCMSTAVMRVLGISEDRADVRYFPDWLLPGFFERRPDPGERVYGVGKTSYGVKRKDVRLKNQGVDRTFLVPFLYSPAFRDDFLVVSLGAIVEHFNMLLTEEQTVLFPRF